MIDLENIDTIVSKDLGGTSEARVTPISPPNPLLLNTYSAVLPE
jgi:hypothetical protein